MPRAAEELPALVEMHFPWHRRVDEADDVALAKRAAKVRAPVQERKEFVALVEHADLSAGYVNDQPASFRHVLSTCHDVLAHARHVRGSPARSVEKRRHPARSRGPT